MGSEDLQWSKSLQLQSLPSAKSLFAHFPIVVCTTQTRLLSPPAHVGLGRICRLISGQGDGGQARAYGSEQSAGARRRGNKLRFLLPSPALQEFRVTSFPPGEDSTAVFPRGFPGPKNLPHCSSASKGFGAHRLPGEEQRSWETAIPGSRALLNVPEGPDGNPDAWEC